jgi:hypothetical protein
MCIRFRKFRPKQEYLGRVIHPQQNDYQTTRRTVAGSDRTAAEVKPDQELADRE